MYVEDYMRKYMKAVFYEFSIIHQEMPSGFVPYFIEIEYAFTYLNTN